MNFIKKTLALGAVLMSFMAVGSQAMAKEYTVKMVTNLDAEQVYYFEPAEITIQPGDTIKWVNVQEDMHNAVADAVPKGAEFFESPMLEEEGASWSYTFNTAGTYSYHCHPHAAAGMKGIITVGAPPRGKRCRAALIIMTMARMATAAMAMIPRGIPKALWEQALFTASAVLTAR